MKKLLMTILSVCALTVGAIAFSSCDNGDSSQGNSDATSVPQEKVEQLEYAFSDTKNAYVITGIGSYTDTTLDIPTEYKGEPVIEIADGAFFENDKIVEVNIPNGIQRIGDCAFYRCNGLKNISIGKDVKEIGPHAFYCCYAVENLYYNVGKELYDLGEDVFFALGNDSWNRLSVTIGNAVKGIPYGIFKDTFVTALTFEENSACETVGGYAFYNTELEEVQLPESVTLIGKMAFYSADNLKSVAIPAQVKEISQGAFQYCTELERVTFAENSQLERIGKDAFLNDLRLRNVVLPEILQYIGETAFAYCSALTEIVIPDSVQGTLLEKTFYNCIALNSARIGNGVSVIGQSAFEGCNALESVTFGNSLERIAPYAFSGATSLTAIRFPASLKGIGIYAFDQSGLEEVVFENPEAWVGTNLGNGVKIWDIEELTDGWLLGWGLRSYYSRYGWVRPSKSSLLIVEAQLGVQTQSGTNENGKGYFQVEIPYATYYTAEADNAITVYDQEWKEYATCSSGEAFALPVGIWYFRIKGAFSQVHLLIKPKGTSVSLGSETVVSYTSNNVYSFVAAQTAEYTISTYGDFNNTLTATISIKKLVEGEWIELSVSNETLYPSLTFTLTKNEEVFIFITVRNAKDQAFVMRIDYTALDYRLCLDDTYAVRGAGLYRSEHIVIPSYYNGKAVTRIDADAFAHCTFIQSVTFSEGMKYIGYGAFEGCLQLQSVKFPSTLETLYSHSFYDCEALTEIAIPAATTSIDHNTFTGCDALMKITVEKGNTVYHSSGNCIIETATRKLLLGCTGSVLPQDGSVTEIGTWAFGDNPCLKKIEISAYITKIEVMAFYKCGGLEEIVVNENNPVFHEAGNCLINKDEKRILRLCSNSTIPSDGSVTKLADGAFSGCVIQNLFIPACIETVLVSSHKIAGLESIVVETGNAHYYSAGNCLISTESQTVSIGCKNSVVPTGVKKIKSYAFEACEIASINIPVTVTEIQTFAFLDCTLLKEIRYEGTREQWEMIEKGGSWDSNTGTYTVVCSDGVLYKSSI